MVRRITQGQLFAPLVQLPKLPLRPFMQPRHPRERQHPGPTRQHDLQPLHQPFAAALLAAVLEPQNPERQDAVDRDRHFFVVHADDCPGLAALYQQPSRICRPKRPLQVHRRPKRLRLPTLEVSFKRSLQHLDVACPRRLPR